MIFAHKRPSGVDRTLSVWVAAIFVQALDQVRAVGRHLANRVGG
jgi:hypothetical protein